MTVTLLGPARVDPLAPTPAGSWSTNGIRVVRGRRPHRAGDPTLCTPRFCAYRNGDQLTVEHDLTPAQLSDELTLWLTEELGPSGILHSQADFEAVFTGIVRSTVPGGLAAWVRFYRNSLYALESGAATFSPIHARAAELVVGGRLLDLGSCFGFFPLRMRRCGHQVMATDLSAPTMGLLDSVATALERPLQTLVCDAARVPLPAGTADTVTVLHLLEHLDADAGAHVLDEALRLARRRVVIAVPFEDEPQACYGHVRRFDVGALHALAARHRDLHATVSEHHGGWLVLDRPPS
ncbi:mycofactocin oligosaccharide methyltransferase MftM [Mycolicibacterium sp. 22603]|uniref:mycofactocin oligosaccharide methyltransferase MftM n=1 Tax=Mycolicibacterium sp. 22603 TaxID=3453950 RepID=UPI003F842A58